MMVRFARLAPLTLAVLLTACASVSAQQVTTPEEHLGRPLGTDFKLADWDEVSSYYRTLGQESPRVVTERLGETTEGRDFLISIISSEENLANLEQIRRYSAVLADPRGRSAEEKREAVENGKVILLVSPQMHSTEAGGTEAIMRFAHALATSDEEPWTTARENLVVGVFPCTNPDGLDRVVHWYREHVGTPYEATGLLELYQKYAGHDNNRDWFMLTQDETKIVTNQLYNVWRPQVYWDVHQQGSRSERMFVPPFRDPLNPNLDPAIIAGIDTIGSRALLDMTRAGLTGVSTGVTYDMWWTGGNRNVPVRHNIIGLLTEAASVDLATPIFLRRTQLRAPGDLPGYHPSNQFPDPWPGGWWRLRDINEYQFQFGKSLVGTLAREPSFWLQNALDAAERTIREGAAEGPRAWLIPSDNRDPDAVRRLVEVLLRSGVELHVTPESIEADGRTYPAGTIVIHQNQPYGAHVKDLLEVQRYPEGPPPYDVAGWTLPHLLGVRRVTVMEELEGDFDRAESVEVAVAGFAGDERAAHVSERGGSTRHSDSWRDIFDALENDDFVSFAIAGDRAGLYDIGNNSTNSDQERIRVDRLPRIGLYAPWSGSMDEGWMRWVFDTWDVPYTRVRNEQVRAGELGDFLDVLIIPDIRGRQLDEGRTEGTVPNEYASGLAPEGAVAIEEFVRSGGRLITFDASSEWAIELFQLPLVDVTREESGRDFSCPGSVLRAIPQAGQTWTAGLPGSLGLFFSRSTAWRPMNEAERKESGRDEKNMTTLLRYAPTRVLLSGWIREPQVIAGHDAWVRAHHGHGDVHLFAFRPQYRGWTQSTFPLVFRAILFEDPPAEN